MVDEKFEYDTKDSIRDEIHYYVEIEEYRKYIVKKRDDIRNKIITYMIENKKRKIETAFVRISLYYDRTNKKYRLRIKQK